MHLILASASPRRAELLRAAGFSFDAVAVDVDESIRPGESPSAYVRRLAADKSAAVSGTAKAVPYNVGVGPYNVGVGPYNVGVGPYNVGVGPRFSGAETPVILGADTTVVVDGEILGKPQDEADAAAMLRRLSGRTHQVLTGVSLRRGAHEVGRAETTVVVFHKLSEEDIAWYVASGEGRDKAGAYAIQGLASRFIPRIEGSYSNVVGLPVACVSALLREISGTQPGRSSRRPSAEG